MSKLPVVSGQECVRALERAGFYLKRTEGSHIILRQTPDPHRRLVIPDHKEIARGTLRAIIKQAGLTVEEFNDLLR